MNSTSPPRQDRQAADAAAAAAAGQWLSALADGEREAAGPAVALWRDDPAARQDWHLYHLIGDVLRSEDLALPPRRDAQLLSRVREQLAREPVPLAPAVPVVPGMARRLGWRAPAAVAAGFVAVAAALVVMRPAGQGPAGAQVAGDRPPGADGATAARSLVAAPAAGGPLVANGEMIRDPRLNAYLQAHQAARGGAPAALPFGGLRNAEAVVVPMAPSRLAPPPAASEALPALRAASEAR